MLCTHTHTNTHTHTHTHTCAFTKTCLQSHVPLVHAPGPGRVHQCCKSGPACPPLCKAAQFVVAETAARARAHACACSHGCEHAYEREEAGGARERARARARELCDEGKRLTGATHRAAVLEAQGERVDWTAGLLLTRPAEGGLRAAREGPLSSSERGASLHGVLIEGAEDVAEP